MNICKKIISTICASVFVFSCFGFNASAEEDSTEKEPIFYNVSYITMTDHYSEAKHSGSYDVSWTENGRYVMYRTEVLAYDDDGIKSLSVKISRIAGGNYYHIPIIGNISYSPNELSVKDFTEYNDIGVGVIDLNANLQHTPRMFLEVRDQFNTSKRTSYEENFIAYVNFYVNQGYLGKNITISIFDANIEIPLIDNNTDINVYKAMDFDSDGLLTNADAQMILVYYTDSLVDKTTGKVEDYSEYVKQISG